MSFEEEFDKGIRQKADELKYPFDQSNWEKASRMIDADRKAARKGYARFYVPVSILVLLLGTGVFLIGNLSTNDSGHLGQNVTGPIKKTTKPADKLSEKQDLSGMSPKPQAPALANPESPSAESTGLTNQSENSDPIADVTNSGRSALKIKKSGSLQSKLPESNNPSTRQGQTTIPVQAVVSGVMAEEGSAEPGSAEPGIIGDQASAGAENIEILASHFMFLPGENNSPEPVLAITGKGPEDYYQPKKRKFHYLNLEAGGVWLNGWNTRSGPDGKGINGFAGVNYGIYFSKNLSIGTGIQIYNIGNIRQPFHTATSKEYGFYSVTSETVVTARSLFYLSMPLKLYYDLNADNRIGAGMHAGYYTGSLNTVNSYQVQDGARALKSQEKNTGVYDHITAFNILLCGSFSTRISKRISAGGELVYGLTDLFANTTFKKDIEKSAGIRISLQYTLFDK